MFEIGDIVKSDNLEGIVTGSAYSSEGSFCNIIECENPTILTSYDVVYNNTDKELDINTRAKNAYWRYCQLYPMCVHVMSEESIKSFGLQKIGTKELPQYKFKIGDIVCTNKTGPLNIGKISGITSIGYKSHTPQRDFSSWGKIYPDWEDKPIYNITFDEPHFSVSKQEYLDYCVNYTNQAISHFPPSLQQYIVGKMQDKDLQLACTKEVYTDYYAKCQKYRSIMAPEDDLSIMNTDQIMENLLNESVDSL